MSASIFFICRESVIWYWRHSIILRTEKKDAQQYYAFVLIYFLLFLTKSLKSVSFCLLMNGDKNTKVITVQKKTKIIEGHYI